MPIYPGIKPPTMCIHCQKEIPPEERPYFSKQAGMEGFYHWSCFTAACHEVNRHGQALLEEALLACGIYHDPNTYETIPSPPE